MMEFYLHWIIRIRNGTKKLKKKIPEISCDFPTWEKEIEKVSYISLEPSNRARAICIGKRSKFKKLIS